MSGDVFGDDDGFDVVVEGGAVENEAELYSGNRVAEEGFFHITCLGYEVFNNPKDKENYDPKKLCSVSFDYQVLRGSSDRKGTRELTRQVGKTVKQRIFMETWEDKATFTKKPSLSEQQWQGIRQHAYAFGLITKEQLNQSRPIIKYALIEGRQAIVKVSKGKEYEGNDGQMRDGGFAVQWPNEAWPVTHESVSAVLKDAEYLAMLNVSGGGPLDI